MGYLHSGHVSLVRAAREKSDIVVVSVFVNPAQFGPNEDFDRYPRDFEKDKKLLEDNSADYIFYPDRQEIYSDIFKTYVEVTELSQILEGEFRPIHFKGVTTVVAILFNIVKPHIAFFGQKDAQQAAIIKQMVNDLHFGIDINICPIIREEDGLAMSSRNIYLSPEERKTALILYNTLQYGAKFFEDGEMNPQIILDNMRNQFSGIKNVTLDYVSIVNAYTFSEPLFIEQGNEYYILIAARIGKTRLIDNMLITVKA
jgi:pantoate--beta-alanine ligase